MPPKDLSRATRRRLDRRLNQLAKHNACSLCGREHAHNSRTFGGLTKYDEIALAGECCCDQISTVHWIGLYSARRYEFLQAGRGTRNRTPCSNDDVIEGLSLLQNAIADTDERVERSLRRAGGANASKEIFVSTKNHPWMIADRLWFKEHRNRSHRIRLPLPGESDNILEQHSRDPEQLQAQLTGVPDDHTMVVLVRQTEPGMRLRCWFYLNNLLLPLTKTDFPETEAIVHALFDVVWNREALPNTHELITLVDRYLTNETVS
jgi:hypothetical protein